MDIVDYINEVDRSNREQETAYHVTLSKRDFRIPMCVLCSSPLLRRGLLHLYHITGITTKIYTFVGYKETERFLYAKSPCPQ